MVKFYTSTMKQGKSLIGISLAKQALHTGKTALVCKPKADTRDGNTLTSRLGLSIQCEVFEEVKDTFVNYDVVIIDEVQFLSIEDINNIFKIAITNPNIEFYCFGLLTDFNLQMFEGSKRLIELGAQLFEIPSLSPNKIVNALLDEQGNVVRSDGDNVVIESEHSRYETMTLEEYWKQLGIL